MTDSFETGGSERQFVELARSLRNPSFRLHIGCMAKRGGLQEGIADAVEFSPGGSLWGLASLRARLRLARYLKTQRVTIAHSFDLYTNLLLIPAAKLAGVPVVIGSQRQVGDLLSWGKTHAQMAAFHSCERVVCNSRAAAERLIARGLPDDRVAVIGNGLPNSAFTPTLPAVPRRPDVLRVGMIARMNTPSKNHRDLLQAAALLRRRFPALEFVLAGDGPMRSQLELLAETLGIRDCVHFIGDRRDIPGVLASVDISVLPSVSESLSNAILESMAAGVPVVAANVGGNPELIAEDRGVLVPPNDTAALASAIENLLQDSAMRTALAKNARQFVGSKFTIDVIRKRYEELYLQLLDEKRQRPNARHSADANRYASSIQRVAIVAPSLRYVGGQSAQADLLLANWRGDPEVRASSIVMDPPLPRGFKWIETVPFLRTIVREPFYLASLWTGIRAADVVHIFSASYWSFLIATVPAWLIARARGRKSLIHYHSGEARDHLRRFRSARPALASADALVVPSQHLVDVFREFGLRAETVPNVVDLAQFAFRRRAPLRPHLVCTRGFHPYYRADLVVRAFARVRREFPSARLDLVGQGSDEPQIRRLVAKRNIEGIRFCGVASRREISCVYDEADIFINASELDNMPVSILEAFACGTPVVSTAPEGMRHLIEHGRTGLLSEPGDVDGLARNVSRLLRDPELASRIALNALEQSHLYTWTAVRDQWLAIYRSLAERGWETTVQATTAA
ncbi:MAG TPA: glycosyltransferase [Verrucomicrobiae bacterium]|nr:glycosyltransferase [Verrucomicrobiae bacterium]